MKCWGQNVAGVLLRLLEKIQITTPYLMKQESEESQSKVTGNGAVSCLNREFECRHIYTICWNEFSVILSHTNKLSISPLNCGSFKLLFHPALIT